MNATMNAAKMRPEIIAGVFYGEINGEDREPNRTAQAIANVLEEIRRTPQPEDETDCRLMYFYAASRWLGENAIRRAADSKSSIRQARAEGYEEVENLSRHHAVMNALYLTSHWMFHALAKDSELAADVQSVYAGTLSRIRNEGITVELLNPVQVQQTMNGLAATARTQDIDQRIPRAAMAALEVARLVSLNLRHRGQTVRKPAMGPGNRRQPRAAERGAAEIHRRMLRARRRQPLPHRPAAGDRLDAAGKPTEQGCSYPRRLGLRGFSRHG